MPRELHLLMVEGDLYDWHQSIEVDNPLAKLRFNGAHGTSPSPRTAGYALLSRRRVTAEDCLGQHA
jgi:hypothetical protein